MIRDRHSRTERRLAFRRRVKRYALPLAGFLALAAIGEIAALDLTAVAAGIWGGMAAFLDQIGIDLGTYSASRPIVNGLVGAVLGSLATGLLGRLGVFDRLFPDPPGFVFCDLEVERSRSLLEVELGAPTSFVGRGEELEALEALLENPSPQRFRWQTVTAPSGVGKTRLAIEWLERAEKAEWDIGVIDPDQLGKVKAWKARRPTALVLDEADSGFYLQLIGTTTRLAALLGDLLRASSKQAPVRLLLLGQSTVWAAGQAPDAIRPYAVKDPLALTPLDDEAMGVLATELARHSGGDAELITARQEAAFAAIERWNMRFDSLLAIPTLAANVDVRLNEAKASVNAIKYYGEVGAAGVEGAFAALESWAGRIDRLISVPELGANPKLRLFEAEAAVNAIGTYGRVAATEWVKAYTALERWGERLAALVAVPLFADDLDIRLREAMAVMNAVTSYGKFASGGQSDAFLALERWGTRLDAALAVPVLAADQAIRSVEAQTVVNAVMAYGEVGASGRPEAFAALERWAERLDAISAIPSLANDPSIRLAEAKAVTNAINSYGEAAAAGQEGAFSALERWERRLDVLLSEPSLSADPSLRLQEAKAAVNAINFYGVAGAAGQAGAFAALERWASVLMSWSRCRRSPITPQFDWRRPWRLPTPLHPMAMQALRVRQERLMIWSGGGNASTRCSIYNRLPTIPRFGFTRSRLQ